MFDPREQTWTMIASMSTRRSSVGVGVVNNLLYAVSNVYFISLVYSLDSFMAESLLPLVAE